MSRILIHYGTRMPEMTCALLEAANVSAKIKSSMHVVIKPNLVVSRPASDGATTHPEIVEGVIRYLKDNGINNISIAEGAWVGDSTERAFKNCGYTSLAKTYNVKLIDTKKDRVVKTSSHGIEIGLCESLVKADYFINVPVLKGHCQTRMTCCLKNLKGCISDSEKRRFHTIGLHKPIAVLASLLKPDLYIIDGICGDLSFEEGGTPVPSNRILLGFDPVLLDSYGAQLMGYQPDEIEHLRHAKEYGVGQYVTDQTEIVEFGVEDRPKIDMKSTPIARQFTQYIDEDGACSACYAALVFALNKVKPSKSPGKIKIGQGFRGKTCPGIGIGNCTAGCETHVKGCPPKAIDIVELLLSR
ncbi:MAG: DUF362 domain-containing protein [Planctomycetaceae bacterium]|nr:DUF362 domain-containing protein [Planctomycetaceae bacterium]